MGRTSHSDGRRQAIAVAGARAPREIEPPTGPDGRHNVSSIFGSRTFGPRQMRERLPAPDYQALLACLESGRQLDSELAAAVAHSAKEWAIEQGATHFTHWFQPLTGLTAEKHDAFLSIAEDGEPIERFDRSQLVQSEPDASSFPSGGMRTTFEARGYTAWDPSSPMFIMKTRSGSTLCIPSAYLSYMGHALDEKTGLLRSNAALRTAVASLCETLGEQAPTRVTATVGPEQEYFLVDRAFSALRPDWIMSGRTLLGSAPPKGQQLDDHYFGAISPRVNAFMNEFEAELYLLGVPVKTRHNEVAPGQYEMAPIFEEAQVAADHNQLAMEVMRRVARRHNFDVSFHEKPFAGINGTGKHLNWSCAAKYDGGSWENFFEPGDTPESNLRFLLMTAAVQKAIHRHAGALRAAISGAGNDHRLGANEAPPAIISIFLGKTLTNIFDGLAEGESAPGSGEQELISLGVNHLPEVKRDNTDRNRTSPFAFTGNKWEFRAAGGSQAISFPITCLNAAAAEAIGEIDADLRSRLEAGAAREDAILGVLRDVARATKAIRFEGNNYSDEWVTEAESRGLPNLRKTPEALAHLADPANHSFLVKQNVFSDDEVMARLHVRVERYNMDVQIEADTMVEMIDMSVVPAVSGYLGDLSDSINSAKAAGISAPQSGRAKEIAGLLGDVCTGRDGIAAVRAELDGVDDENECSRRIAAELLPAMDKARAAADQLEVLCDDLAWPLPRYSEMLFIR